jgi:cation diffusion facilitator CzcD-associated flavoprotein CzcO
LGRIDTNTIIVGAGAAGLACAACLSRKKIPFVILERDDTLGEQWRSRYDRLHLHTPRTHSGLPFLKIPARYPKYPSKNDFAAYLEQYANAFGLKPYFNHQVLSVERENNTWEVATEKNTFHSENVIVATGYARKPLLHQDSGFTGEVIHSADYKNGEKYRNKKVLLVGFGNSACEIAICLHEHHALPAMSVRSGVNIIPRDLAGIPIISIAIAQQWITKISPRLTDLINQPVLKLTNGNLSKSGLKKLPYGPIEQIVKHHKIPTIDIGTLDLIKKKTIKVYPEIRTIASKEIEFIDGRKEDFDAIIFATGYQPALEEFLKHPDFSNEKEIPTQGIHPRLYFCGFKVSPTGMIREIGIQARKIIRHISRNKA